MIARSGSMLSFFLYILILSGYTDLDRIDQLEMNKYKFFSELSCNLTIDSNLLDQSKSGQLPGVDVSIGMSKQEILKTHGMPDTIGEMHATYYKYNGCTFYFDSEDLVRVIDVDIHMTPTQIKEILGGKPFEGLDGEDDSYLITYVLENDYRFYIDYGTENSHEGVLRYKIN
ncbi:DUF4309 domain-containing protein [Chengkuizengella sediminis]|uniref:DUF4309 domain-containing protein n=1 Tax=Chengkuizengella sediminis TaxID=1885917 RepID=UPI00138A578D|nr:DUF4309 domain-containing protein [Chengkuizengella sediminis]NDI34585.1 hypothetical protein [Chengkuizengella sediminis]